VRSCKPVGIEQAEKKAQKKQIFPKCKYISIEIYGVAWKKAIIFLNTAVKILYHRESRKLQNVT